MPEIFVDKLKRCMKPAELVPLICESFPPKKLVKLIASAGTVYPGVRMETVPPEKLALGWIEDAWKDPEVLAELIRALDKVHHRDMARMRLASREEMERMSESVAQICRRSEISGSIWALLRDERADAALVRRFLESLYRFLNKGDAAFRKLERLEDHIRQGTLNKSEARKMSKILANVFEENKQLKQSCEKEVAQKNNLILKIDELRKNVAERQAEISALKNELAALRREAVRKDSFILELEHKVNTFSQGEKEDLRHRVHDLERNERKLQHEITELGDRLSASRLELQTAEAKHRELQKTFQEERHAKELLEQDIKRLSLRGQADPAPTGKAPLAPGLPKNKGRRLGVFVDTRYLWQASRWLQGKVDYQKLLELAVLDRHLVKAVAYVMTAPDGDSSAFLGMLEKSGFQVRCRRFIRWPDGSIHGGWGAGIAADLISSCEKLSLDIVHLVSGNGDFAEVLKLAKARGGLRIEVSGFKDTTAVELEQASDEFIPLGAEIFMDSGMHRIPGK